MIIVGVDVAAGAVVSPTAGTCAREEAHPSLGSMKARLTERLGANSTFWVDAEKSDAVNEAICVWQAMTGEFIRQFTLSVTSGHFYQVPKQFLSLLRVSWNGSPLRLVSITEIDNGFVGWQGPTGTPRYWAPIGLNMFIVLPAPISGVFTLEGFTENVRLGGSNDPVDIGNEEMNRLLDYADSYCLAPQTKVLGDDLRWKPISDFSVGDRLIAFEESAWRRKWQRAVVLDRSELQRPALHLRFEDGTNVICSMDHLWLVRAYPTGGNIIWRRADELRPNVHRVLRPVGVWEEDTSYDGGYIAAGFDGEGCLVVSGSTYRLSFSQKSNKMLSAMTDALERRGYLFRVNDRPKNGVTITTVCNKAQILRLLGSTRPKRLLPKLDINSFGRMHSESLMLTSLESVGDQKVIGLKTSTGTLIAEGLASHNCSFKEGAGEMESSQPQLASFVKAAALRNGRLKQLAMYRRYMGESRDETLAPARPDNPKVGVRTPFES